MVRVLSGDGTDILPEGPCQSRRSDYMGNRRSNKRTGRLRLFIMGKKRNHFLRCVLRCHDGGKQNEMEDVREFKWNGRKGGGYKSASPTNGRIKSNGGYLKYLIQKIMR
jgi:hypothetical protein